LAKRTQLFPAGWDKLDASILAQRTQSLPGVRGEADMAIALQDPLMANLAMTYWQMGTGGGPPRVCWNF